MAPESENYWRLERFAWSVATGVAVAITVAYLVKLKAIPGVSIK